MEGSKWKFENKGMISNGAAAFPLGHALGTGYELYQDVGMQFEKLVESGR